MQSFDSRSVAILLKDLSKRGLSHRASELFDWLSGLPPDHNLSHLLDVYTYTAMVSICIYQQNVKRAMQLADEMQERNIQRNVHTYTALMSVAIKCGALSLALEIYCSMREAGCVPNVVTFNTLIDVYGKLGDWEKASQVLVTMREVGLHPKHNQRRAEWCGRTLRAQSERL
jgi:pentatricopeptide repeat domain-containing protein 1